jgi:putative membrane protein
MKNAFIKTGSLALLIGVLALASCKKNNRHYTLSNQDFVTQASSGNTFEIQAGDLAQRNGNSADVKSFGSEMITDHGKVGAQMDSLATRKGWTILPDMLPEQRADYDTLSNLTGTAFDKKFAAIMVLSHVKTINLFQAAANDDGVPDPELRSFAASTLPKLREHLQMAQQLQDKIGK